MKEAVKRSPDKHVVHVGDLFYFKVCSDDLSQLMNEWFFIVDELMDNRVLIDALYPCDEIALYDVMVDLKLLFRHDVFLKDVYILKAIKTGLDSVLERNINPSYEDMVQMLIEQLVIEAKRMVLKYALKEVDKACFVYLKSFDFHLLYHLNRYVYGFIIENDFSERDERFAKMTNIKLMKKNASMMFHKDVHIQSLKQLEIYAPVVDMRNLEELKRIGYKGIVWHTAYLLLMKGLMISKREVEQILEEMVSVFGDQMIYIMTPRFNDDDQMMLDPKLKTQVERFSFLHHAIKPWLYGVVKVIQKVKPHVTFIVSHINSKLDLPYWHKELDLLDALLFNGNHTYGMTIETESALQYCEDFSDMHTAIFFLDELALEYEEDLTTHHTQFLYEDLKHAHYIYRVKQPKNQMLFGKVLSHKRSLKRFINMGFRAFMMPYEDLCGISSVLRHWEETRGIYAKKNST